MVFPATPYSAKGLMASALRGSDPVIFFEAQRIYDMPEIFHPEGVPAEYYTVPIGVPEVLKKGDDVTFLTFGSTLYRAWEAAQRLENEFGVSVELIDGQSLVPFDLEIVYESVRKTGKLILGSDACERGAYTHTIASQITQSGVRLSRCASVHYRGRELDRAAGGTRGRVLPKGLGLSRCVPYADQAVAGAYACVEPHDRRDAGPVQVRRAVDNDPRDGSGRGYLRKENTGSCSHRARAGG